MAKVAWTGRLLRWYARHGRASLPWRTQRSPYRTVVSEFMLAQTQVDRVVPKFEAFLRRFPDFTALANASPADVLREWKGLGYNSRAVRLQRLARAVVDDFGGLLPPERERLRTLPGIGPYTAAAIRTFAFGLPDAPVDTNVRRILARLFLGVESPPVVASLVPKRRAHDWASAMMDLGATICTARAPKCPICPLRTDCAAAPFEPQAAPAKKSALPFEQTRRYARGRIVDRLRDLPPGNRISLLDLHRDVARVSAARTFDETRELVVALAREGLVTHDGDHVCLRE